MRLWSLHPQYLDPKGLVALWREALLAKAVLEGKTIGYTRHPQLDRFQRCARPASMVHAYLRAVWIEAKRRDYSFDETKFKSRGAVSRIPVSSGQLRFEWDHLINKLKTRDPRWLRSIDRVRTPDPHPLFFVVDGPVEHWERNLGPRPKR